MIFLNMLHHGFHLALAYCFFDFRVQHSRPGSNLQGHCLCCGPRTVFVHPANAFSVPYITPSHKYIVLATQPSQVTHDWRAGQYATTVNLGWSGFDLTDDFIQFRRRSGSTKHGCF